ncbi:amino acid permease 3 isoform X2 [Eucalyptus grandis]|nr:amino acid permease 3 isoform X2 [Eucalyptus grandis]
MMMSQNRAPFEVSPDLPRDDDGRRRRTGTTWTASARIITAVIGSGILSLPWATAQLGWIAAPAVNFMFAFLTYHTSALLVTCYRNGNPVEGERNYSYMTAVCSHLGVVKEKLCGLVLHLNYFGIAIAFTIAASISMMAIHQSYCFHEEGDKSPCHTSTYWYMIVFGVIEIVLSQIQDFDKLWWLSILATVMSFTYSTIGVALGIAKVVENGKFQGSLTGISIGNVTLTQKIWRSFQALGDIAFAYSFAIILIDIQDTIKSPPSESKTMKKATLISLAVMTPFYLLCGCMVYGAFGDLSPGHLLAGFEFFHPYWLIDIANVAVVIHLVGAYQVYSQPIFAFIEEPGLRRFSRSQFFTREIKIRVPGLQPYDLYVSRLILRTIFVVVTTVISILLPFFNEVIGLLGALGFWPLTVYFPVEMYIAQMEIPKWSPKWLCLQILSVACLTISMAAAGGSIAGVVLHLKSG